MASTTGQTTPEQGELQFVRYQTPEYATSFILDLPSETIWATRQEIAGIFGIDPRTVSQHLGNIFQEGELDQDSTSRNFRRLATNGKYYNYLEYSLDAILSVGYRVSSKRATEFRKWATQILKDHLTKGYTLNERRLRNDRHALTELATKVRALRTEEKYIYEKIRDVFAFGSSDYEASSQAARRFYALLQDKFHYATTGKTAADIILERADHQIRNMGLHSMAGDRPAVRDAVVAKNYLDGEELHELQLAGEHFLGLVESRALRGQQLTMAELAVKFDELLKLHGLNVLSGYNGPYRVPEAKRHALTELQRYRTRMLSEKAGEPAHA